MGRTDIVKAVAGRLGMLEKDVRAVFDAVLEVKADALVAGNELSFHGFGWFRLRQNAPHRRHNMFGGGTTLYPATMTVRFRPSPELVERLNATLLHKDELKTDINLAENEAKMPQNTAESAANAAETAVSR